MAARGAAGWGRAGQGKPAVAGAPQGSRPAAAAHSGSGRKENTPPAGHVPVVRGGAPKAKAAAGSSGKPPAPPHPDDRPLPKPKSPSKVPGPSRQPKAARKKPSGAAHAQTPLCNLHLPFTQMSHRSSCPMCPPGCAICPGHLAVVPGAQLRADVRRRRRRRPPQLRAPGREGGHSGVQRRRRPERRRRRQ